MQMNCEKIGGQAFSMQSILCLVLHLSSTKPLNPIEYYNKISSKAVCKTKQSQWFPMMIFESPSIFYIIFNESKENFIVTQFYEVNFFYIVIFDW